MFKKKANEKRIEVMSVSHYFSVVAVEPLGAMDTRPAKYQVETKGWRYFLPPFQA
jgi:hypothetical protein